MLRGSPVQQRSPRLSKSRHTSTLNGLIKSSPAALQRGWSGHREGWISSLQNTANLELRGQHVIRGIAEPRSQSRPGSAAQTRAFRLHWQPLQLLTSVLPLQPSSRLPWQLLGRRSAPPSTDAYVCGPAPLLHTRCVFALLSYSATGGVITHVWKRTVPTTSLINNIATKLYYFDSGRFCFFKIEIIWLKNSSHRETTFSSIMARFQTSGRLHQGNFHFLINAVIICLLLFTTERSQKRSSISHWEASVLTVNGELLVSQSKQLVTLDDFHTLLKCEFHTA